MAKAELEHEVTGIVETILKEIMAARDYLHMEMKCENIENKKSYLKFAEEEIEHFQWLRQTYEKEKMAKYKELMLDNAVTNMLMGSLDDWEERLSRKISSEKEKLGMK